MKKYFKKGFLSAFLVLALVCFAINIAMLFTAEIGSKSFWGSFMNAITCFCSAVIVIWVVNDREKKGL